jgi:hypothetical protein
MPALVLLIVTPACDDLRRVSNSKHGAYEASMAVLPDGFAVAWYDDRSGNPEIYFRLLDSEGRPKGPEQRITQDAEFSYEADIAFVDGKLAIGWYERFENGDLGARFGLWTLNGERLWTKPISATGRNSRNIVVRADGNELFCAWIEDEGGDIAAVWGGWWNLNGDSITLPRRLAPASWTTWNLNAAVDSERRAWIVFDAKAGTRANELFLLQVEREKTNLLRLSSDDGFRSKYPDLAFSPDKAAITWFDERDGNQEVYLFVSGLNHLPDDIERRARRITYTPAESIGAYVAWHEDHFGLAWCDRSAGQHEIYFQGFDATGLPRDPAHRLTHTRTDSLIPAIKGWASTFALVWNEYAATGPGHAGGGRSEIVFRFAPLNRFYEPVNKSKRASDY